VLETSVREALELFENQPAMRRILETLDEVGLGYITLGQPATTLSGGEAQRIKLARELARRDTGRTLYVLDEPTTGLHFDDVRKLLGCSPGSSTLATACSWSSTTSTSSSAPTGSSTSAPREAVPAGSSWRREHPSRSRRHRARTRGGSCALWSSQLGAADVAQAPRRFDWASILQVEGSGGKGSGERGAVPWGELELAREALRSTKVGAWTWDIPANELLWSDDVCELFAVSREQFGGSYEDYLALLPGDARACVTNAVRRCLEGELDSYVLEHELVPAGSTPRWLECRGRIWRSVAGTPLRMAGTVVDVTARRKIEADRDRLREELERARHLESLGRLASGVAHDFNNLLTIILGYSELAMRQPAASGLGITALTEIASAATKASDLTTKLLAFARRQTVEPTHEDVGLLTRELGELLARTAGEGIVVEVSVPEEILVAYVDRGQLEQVLINLVANARDAMPRGGRISLAVTALPADEIAGMPDGGVGICVVDEGTGMDEVTRVRAFDPFFTTKPRELGTGLGLASALGFIRQAGGTIALESEPGRGTTVAIVLPRSTNPASQPPARKERPLPGSGTVLLVEDNEAVRTVAARALADHGYTVLEARDAADALERAAAHGALDAAVIDIVLPGASGLELADALVRRFSDLPVVFVSGIADEPARRGAGTPERRFMRKPYAPVDLVRLVEAVLAPA
jgi:two-component system, cell cycle sensor histidine kinase and response regulator CckA